MGLFENFPYTNFHEINLDQIIKIMRQMQDEWRQVENDWDSMRDFINNYFDNLDVSEEVLQALQTMAGDGELNKIIDPVIVAETAAWLTEHITPTSPAVDNTLSISGAAADAKATGDAVSDLKEDLTGAINALENGYDTIYYDRILNKGFDRNTGTFPDETGWDITDYITVNGGETLYIDNPLAGSAYNGWYTEDKTYISWFTVNRGSDIEITVPYAAAFAVFSNRHAVFDFTIRRNVKVLATKDEVNPMYINGEYSFQPGYITSDGDISTASGAETKEIVSDLIPVKPNWNISWTMTQTSQVAKWCAFCFYDADYQLVGNRLTYTPSLDTDYYHRDITVPDNAKYMRFSYRTYGNTVSLTIIVPITYNVYRNQIDAINTNAINNSGIKSINHRGYNVTAPENTMAAFKESVKHGFRYIETDLAFTSDGVAVLLHDETINRTARNADGTAISSTINIYDITYTQALTYDFGIWKGTEYAGEKIPTLAEFLDFCKSTGVHPYIELKYSTGWTQEQVLGTLNIIKAHGMYKKCTIISFIHGYLTAWIAQDTNSRIGVLCGTPTAEDVTYAVTLKTSTNEVFIDAQSAPSEVITSCITNNIPVELWVLNSLSDIENIDPYITGVASDSQLASVILYNKNMN